jgi:hypothetical protein
MSSAFYPKDSLAMDRSLKVQKLTIPFTVTFSATAANVVPACDEPSLCFFKTAGVDQITAQDTATYSTSPVDATGQFDILVKVGESVAKVQTAKIKGRFTGTDYAVHLDAGGTQGVSPTGNIMLSVTTSVNFTTTSLDACLEVEYVVSE